jgi:hypothetical protein
MIYNGYEIRTIEKEHGFATIITRAVYKNNIETYINKYGCWKDICFIIEKCKKNNFEYKLIANRLNQDLKIIEHGKDHISLCSKWVFNANTKESNKLCKYLFDKSEVKKEERYRKEYLKPLRTKLNLIESKICTKNWDEIDYFTHFSRIENTM